jgi:hypothetical protein
VNLQESALFIDDAYVRPLFVIASIFLLYLNYSMFFEKKLGAVVKAILALLIIINIAVNGLWLLRPTFSMYETSKYIGSVSHKGDIIVGSYAMISAIENKTFPLWWIPNIKYNENLSKINRDSKLIFKAKYLIITDALYKAGEDPKKSGPTVKDIKVKLHKTPKYVDHFTFIPFRFVNNYWIGLNLLELKDTR